MIFKKVCSLFFYLPVAGLLLFNHSSASFAAEPAISPAGPLPGLLATAYPVGEVLHYDITWMGFLAGRLALEIKQLDEEGQLFAIEVVARSSGLLKTIYPVEDNFRIVVQGDERLPSHYLAHLRHGKRRNTRDTAYDQQAGLVTHRRDQKKPKKFRVDGVVHNEFSAFYITRVMPLVVNGTVMVPAFADDERHEVTVVVEGLETINSILGRRQTMRVRPKLTFAGLYDKAGDPQIWMTNDSYRVPLLIRSKLSFGSVTATLVHYEGPLLPAKK